MKKGRPRKLEPFLRGKTYFASFYRDGKRHTKSLKTRDLTEALLLCKELEILCLNPEAQVSTKAQSIYTGHEKLFKLLDTTDDIFQDFARLQHEVKHLREQIEILRPYKEKYEALIQEREYRQLESFKELPAFITVFEKYKINVQHLKDSGQEHKTLIEDLGNHQNLWASKISRIEINHLTDFLEFYSTNKKVIATGKKYKLIPAPNPAERWNRARRKLHRFFKWVSINHNIDNLVTRIETKKEPIKGGIKWPTLEEVQEELKHQNNYWRAIIGVMAFAGLSAHEVRGLKKEDVTKESISVHPTEERSTKTYNRIRQVKIHEKYLKPLLDEYEKERKESSLYFPSCVAGSELWRHDTFSNKFRKILKNKDITALTLRRTFGSLLLRSGKSSAEVAAAMGNTEEMVRKHYARLLGSEVDIDF